MKKRFVVFFWVMVVLSACKNEDEIMREEIIGTWDVYASEMNNQPNGFMKDAYFTFTKDAKVVSNLFPQNQEQNYNLEEGRLQIDIPEGFDLLVTRLEQDTLWMEGKLSYYFMKYAMVKRKP